MKVFKKGQTVTARFICDYDSILTAVVVKRTAKFVTLKAEGYTDQKRVRITEYGGAEQCFPLGKYSMAPIFRAA